MGGLTITTVTGKTIDVALSDRHQTTTIAKVKDEIKRQLGPPDRQQHLVWYTGADHIVLEDGRTLGDYGIEPEATINFKVKCSLADLRLFNRFIREKLPPLSTSG